jgi:AraC-like DNA-binding protein
VNVIRPPLLLLKARGVETSSLLARHQIAPTLLDDAEARIPIESAYGLIGDAIRILDEPDFGLLSAEKSPVGVLGVSDYAVAASDTLGEAYVRRSRLHRLVSDLGYVELTQEGERARLILRIAPTMPDRIRRHVAEGRLAYWLRLGRELTGVAWNPRSVRFCHPAPASLDNHHRLLGAQVLFGESTDEIEFDRSLLALPIRSADPRLAAILDQYAKEILERLPEANDLLARVRQILVRLATGGQPTLSQVARDLRVTSRTLQRRLAERDISFRRIVDESRRELAMRYVLRDDLSVTDVGRLLGFESAPSFQRAFRRWTGTSPGEYRSARKS